MDPTLPTLETSPFRAVSEAGTEKTGSPPAPPPRPPALPPAPSSPEPPPAPGDLLPPSQTPRVPAPAPWSPQAPRAEMLRPPICPRQPSPSFRPLGATSSMRPSQTPLGLLPRDGVADSGHRVPSSGTRLSLPAGTVSRGERPGFRSLPPGLAGRDTPLLARGLQPFGCVSTPTGLGKPRVLGPTPRVSDSTGLGWSPEICLCKEFSGDSTGLEPTLRTAVGEPVSERHTRPSGEGPGLALGRSWAGP